MTTRVLTAHVPIPSRTRSMRWRRGSIARGWIVKQALAAWVDLEEERHRMTLDALADVDAGRVIDQERVQRWAESLSSDTPLPPPAA